MTEVKTTTSQPVRHPIFPFIEAATVAAYKMQGRYSLTCYYSADDEMWVYKIAEELGTHLCVSAKDALQFAERMAFLNHPQFIKDQITAAKKVGNVELALRISERQGFYRGYIESKRDMKERLKPYVAGLVTIGDSE